MICFSLSVAQTLRKVALLRELRNPLQGGAQQVEGREEEPSAPCQELPQGN